MALGLDDLAIGTWTSPAGDSGCTVVVPPPATVGSVAIRGQAPGTREASALAPERAADHVDAVVLSGGSAFGLATADGVMLELEAQGRGHPVPGGVVPIVAAAIILDRAAVQPSIRPDAAAGRAATRSAVIDDPAAGRVGAGAGATVAKVGGIGHGRPGGQGLATRRWGDLVVGALVVNNAVGEVVGEDGTVLVGCSAPDDATRWPADPTAIMRGVPDMEGEVEPSPRHNTVVGVVVTNATLTKAQAYRLADLAHDGLARAVRPAHTSLDGDALFGLATGRVEAGFDHVVDLAVEAVAEAARNGPLASAGPVASAPDG